MPKSRNTNNRLLVFWSMFICGYTLIEITIAKPAEVQQTFNVERVTPALELGEGPHWDSSTRSLYFVDLHQGKINRYHPESNGFFSAKIEGYNDVTLIIPIEDKADMFVVGLGPSIGIVHWDGRSNTTSQPDQVAEDALLEVSVYRFKRIPKWSHSRPILYWMFSLT